VFLSSFEYFVVFLATYHETIRETFLELDYWAFPYSNKHTLKFLKKK